MQNDGRLAHYDGKEDSFADSLSVDFTVPEIVVEKSEFEEKRSNLQWRRILL